MASGFTVLETLIAGLVVAAVMTAVGRLGVSAMATSRNQSSRNTIEAAINNHIQLVQMQDSYLTKDAIEDETGLNTTIELACQNPSTFLMEHLQKPEIVGLSPNPSISISWDDTNPNLLVLTYSFEGPESNIGTEKRLAEINPNFSSQCYNLQ
jgi:Tfp pilus assembly protein PilV